jgi:GMP synthase PP-ATPase subunit
LGVVLNVCALTFCGFPSTGLHPLVCILGLGGQVVRRLRDECGVDLQCVDAKELFLGKLAGVSDPETKRKIIGVTFCEVCCWARCCTQTYPPKIHNLH